MSNIKAGNTSLGVFPAAIQFLDSLAKPLSKISPEMAVKVLGASAELQKISNEVNKIASSDKLPVMLENGKEILNAVQKISTPKRTLKPRR